MDQSKERFEALAEKWLNGTITPEEQKEFAQWYSTFPEDPLKIPRDVASSEVQHRSRLLRGIFPPKQRKWVVPAAAAILLLIGSATWFLLHEGRPHVVTAAASLNAARASKNKGVLTLADGSQVVLDGLADGKTVMQPGAIVTRADTNLLSYKVSGATQETAAPEFNTLTTPRGVVFQLQLADGSRVWLNAASSLRFPTIFTGKQRDVYLTGQAYFEVAKDKNMPFMVHSDSVTVKVLGTAFDMMAYQDEDAIRTTLAEGAIVVNAGGAEVPVHPGQQASLSRGNDKFVLSEPDLDDVFAWKEGRFRFSNTNIRSVMRQVERWYDVTVEYQGDVSDLNLTGSVSRKGSVEELLAAFERTGGVHFTIENNKIVVTAH